MSAENPNTHWADKEMEDGWSNQVEGEPHKPHINITAIGTNLLEGKYRRVTVGVIRKGHEDAQLSDTERTVFVAGVSDLGEHVVLPLRDENREINFTLSKLTVNRLDADQIRALEDPEDVRRINNARKRGRASIKRQDRPTDLK